MSEKRTYELMVIISSNIPESKQKKFITDIKKHIISCKGEIIKEDVWGVREFEYCIKKEEKGYYVVFLMNIDPGEIEGLNEYFNLEPMVLRYLVFQTPKFYEFLTYKDIQDEEEKYNKEIELGKTKRSKNQRIAPERVKNEAKKTIPVKEKKVEAVKSTEISEKEISPVEDVKPKPKSETEAEKEVKPKKETKVVVEEIKIEEEKTEPEKNVEKESVPVDAKLEEKLSKIIDEDLAI